jgi:serine/threonine protein kinase
MLNLLDSIRGQCADVDPKLVEMHFRRLPTTYFEQHSAAEVARHLRLLGGLAGVHAADVDVRPLTSQVFEITVVGLDHSGTLACITAALAAYGFDLEDVRVFPYLDAEPGPSGATEPTYFVIVLRVSGGLHGWSLAAFRQELGDRLRLAFRHLAEGNLHEAQTVAADTRLTPADGHTTPPPAETPAARPAGYEGLVLGNDFRLDRKLATGGMSEIYLATQISLDRTVAVKVFRHEGTADDEQLGRFYQEALVLAQFSCAHIVQILAAGAAPHPAEGVLGWMAMEYLAAGDLGHWLQQQGPPHVDLGLRWFRQALEGLQYAHRRAILHRDLKPHNLLITSEGELKVSDFGLLKHAQQLPLVPELEFGKEPQFGNEPQTAIVGTPHYMSPEQALGESLDERSDIFSLGTTFFYLLSGRLPFQGNTPTAVLLQIAQQPAPRLNEVAPHLPMPLTVLIGRMMARQREERYQDVGVILEDLASYERRGLLNSSQSGSFAAVPPLSPVDRGAVDTQAYQPPPEGHGDLVV